MAERSAKHEATNQTPATMMLGRQLTLPVDLELGGPPDARQTIPIESDYVRKLRERIEDVHKYARECIEIASERMRRHYNMSENTPQYAIGRKVWLYDPSKKKEICPKLQFNWKGSFEVIERLSDVTYRIQESRKLKSKVVHLDRLTAVQGD
jgi:hypothetical protein